MRLGLKTAMRLRKSACAVATAETAETGATQVILSPTSAMKKSSTRLRLMF